jgi:hypothetical protein
LVTGQPSYNRRHLFASPWYLVSRQTLADGSTADILALCAAAADSLGAGVGAAAGAAVRAAHIATAARAHRTLPAPAVPEKNLIFFVCLKKRCIYNLSCKVCTEKQLAIMVVFLILKKTSRTQRLKIKQNFCVLNF